MGKRSKPGKIKSTIKRCDARGSEISGSLAAGLPVASSDGIKSRESNGSTVFAALATSVTPSSLNGGHEARESVRIAPTTAHTTTFRLAASFQQQCCGYECLASLPAASIGPKSVSTAPKSASKRLFIRNRWWFRCTIATYARLGCFQSASDHGLAAVARLGQASFSLLAAHVEETT